MNRNLCISLFLLASFCTFTGCKKSTTTTTSNPVVVSAQQVENASISKPVNISGNVEGEKTVRLGFMVAGKIDRITKEEGEKIKKGALLASLEPENYRLARDIAKAKYDEVQDEYNRLSEMYKKGSLSESDYVKISSGLEQAKAQYKLREKNLNDTHLYAPISGVLLKRGVEPGEIIGQGTPVFAISNISTVQINAAVPEGELSAIHMGDLAKVEIPSLDSTFTGKITLIGAAAEPSTRTFTIKIDIANPDMLLRPGMVAEIKISTNKSENLITLSPSAVLKDVDNTTYVYVADKEKGKAYKRKVSVGSLVGNHIAITSGLNSGEWVVTAGQNKLQDGSAIAIK